MGREEEKLHAILGWLYLESCLLLLQVHDDPVELDLVLAQALVQRLHLEKGVPETRLLRPQLVNLNLCNITLRNEQTLHMLRPWA